MKSPTLHEIQLAVCDALMVEIGPLDCDILAHY